MFLPLLLTKTVLDNEFEQDKQFDFIGTAYLVKALHEQLPSDAFLNTLNTYPDEANIPVKLTELAKVPLSKTILDDLKNDQMVVQEVDGQHILFSLLNDMTLLQVGPMLTVPLLEELTIWYDASLAWVIALSLLLIIFSLQRKLYILEKAAYEFGKGNLSYRISTRKKDQLGKLNSSFNQMATLIERAVNTQKHFINAAAHELRTPLSRVCFELNVLEGDCKTAQQIAHIESINQDIEELSELIDELLSYAKLESNQHTTPFESHCIASSISMLVEQHKKLAPEVLLDVNKHDNAQDTVIYCNLKAINRAISNLLTNALKHASTRVQITSYVEASQLYIVVEDDGQGIDAKLREQVFEPFARLDGSRTKETGGFGLGLAIVKQIAHWHQGKVYVERSELGGAKFILMLPTTHAIDL